MAFSTLTSLISRRLGAPILLIFLAVGLLAGEDGLIGIDFDSGGIAYFIGSLALAIILFDSGVETPLSSYRLAARRIRALLKAIAVRLPPKPASDGGKTP